MNSRLWKVFAASCVVGGGVAAALARPAPIVNWPSIPASGEVSPALCRTLDRAFIDLTNKASQDHEACLNAPGASRAEAGPTCSRRECQAVHALLYTEIPERRRIALNDCAARASASAQRCIGRFANQESALQKQRDALHASQMRICYGGAHDPATARFCSNLEVQIAAIDRQLSSLGDQRRASCNPE